VSVGLPVYNGERFLDRALRALRAQDYEDFELLVSDNGSTDATHEIAAAHAESDDRIRVLHSDENHGAAWNFNRVLSEAQGRYFKWAAYDDLVAEGYLSACVEALESAPSDVVLVYPRTSVIDNDDRVVSDFYDGLELTEPAPWQRLRHLLLSDTEYHPVFGLMRRNVVISTRGIQPFGKSDIAFLAEMSMRGKFVEIPDRLFLRRFHEETSVRSNPTGEQLLEWFAPRLAGRRALPMTRLTGELLRAVQRAPLPTRSRAACARVVVSAWMMPRWRVLAGEMKQHVSRRRRTQRAHNATTSA